MNRSRRGVRDKPMPCKPGVAGSIPGFTIKTTFGEPLGVPVIKPIQILNQPGGTGLYTGKPQKGVGDKPMSCKPGVAGSISGFSQRL